MDDALVLGLLQPRAYSHPVTTVVLIETHISWVFLTGEFAYKVKKPVNLGFLDFSTLKQRLFYCNEELRLNRRSAPDEYLDVVSISGTREQPVVDAKGPALEYALKMRQFRDGYLLHDAYMNRPPTASEMDALADQIARFHGSITGTKVPEACCEPNRVQERTTENFDVLRSRDFGAQTSRELDCIAQWSEQQGSRLRNCMNQRYRNGYVRECHGDLHLGNIYWRNAQPLIFDCIEFAPDLRWIDVMSDVAFLTMDLHYHGHGPAATRFMNRYLHHTGDYSGLALWRYYQVYRAMVRAKIAAFRAAQSDGAEKQSAIDEVRRYITLAGKITITRTPKLILTHGLSGSGKSSVSKELAPELSAVWLRSDIERKRLYKMSANAHSNSDIGGGIYDPTATQATYAALLTAAENIVEAGYSVIIDATFLQREHREAFAKAAKRWRIPFRILHCHAPLPTLHNWLIERENEGTDASEATVATLEYQTAHQEPLTLDEEIQTVVVQTDQPVDMALLASQIDD